MRSIGFGVLLAVLVYAAFAVHADARALTSSFASIDPLALLAALALSTINYGVRFGRWTLYLDRLSVRIPWTGSLRIFTAGLTMSVTPGKLGEAWKSLLLREAYGAPIARTAGVVVAERLTDLLALLLLLSIAAWRALDPRLGAITLALAMCLWALFAFPVWTRPVGAALERIGRRGLSQRLEHFVASTSTLLHPSLLVLGTLIASVGWALEGYALGLLAAGLGHSLPPSEALFIYATATLAGGISMIPGGLGVTEGSMTALLSRALPAASAPDRVALALLSRFTTLWWGVALGVLAHLGHVRAQRRK